MSNKPRTIVHKVYDTTVKRAIEAQLKEVIPAGYYVKELVHRPSGGWLMVLEPRSLNTPAAL